ncbi:hypothetical protein QBC44DRAFT_2479 [Cladorrhinum sp. PSN332]|nr:hypothetical protein QBC44DRAFT_2479 [Cladorrhinum sp. PSN332]
MKIPIPTARMLSLIFGTSLLAATTVLADPNAPCYFPGGSLAPGYFACHAFGREVSSCCAPGWTCFSNSLCIATTETRSWPNISIGAVQRGACTAPRWDNEFCGSVCLTGDNTDGRLAACGNDRYCCSSDFEAGNCSCDEGGGSFVVSGGLPQTIIQVTDATFTGSPSISIVTTKPAPRTTGTADSSTSASTTTDSTFATSVTSESGTAGVARVTGTGTPEPPEGDGNRTLKIALGVTIPFILIIIAAVAGGFILKRRREQVRGGGGGGGGGGGRERDTVQNPYVNNAFTVNDGLAETNQYAPNRSFGQHYDGVDGTGNINTRG